MGRKRASGGAVQIDRAEQFFGESGDFRYVALAIGSNPRDPPKWAMWECVKVRLQTEAKASRGQATYRLNAILDGAIWFLAMHRRDQFNQCRALENPSDRVECISQIKPMPLDQAFKKSIEHFDVGLPESASRNVVSTLDALKKAWKREKVEELVDWEVAGREPEGAFLEGFDTTHRIERVMSQFYASDYPTDSPHFYDPDLLIWIAEQSGIIIK